MYHAVAAVSRKTPQRETRFRCESGGSGGCCYTIQTAMVGSCTYWYSTSCAMYLYRCYM
ncbi:hypothetical protein BD777DRAFT_129436 [Yarrowia lipolytica]|nr:hypothetical protein BD777DRAFT_129436 [Yarrowia lipolytica]